MGKKKDDYESDDDEDVGQGSSDGDYIVVWGVEIEINKRREKSHMFSARQLVMDHESVQIQLADGECIVYPIDQVRKVLVMKSTLNPDEIA